MARDPAAVLEAEWDAVVQAVKAHPEYHSDSRGYPIRYTCRIERHGTYPRVVATYSDGTDAVIGAAAMYRDDYGNWACLRIDWRQ